MWVYNFSETEKEENIVLTLTFFTNMKYLSFRYNIFFLHKH